MGTKKSEESGGSAKTVRKYATLKTHLILIII